MVCRIAFKPIAIMLVLYVTDYVLVLFSYFRANATYGDKELICESTQVHILVIF